MTSEDLPEDGIQGAEEQPVKIRGHLKWANEPDFGSRKKKQIILPKR